MAQIPTVIGLLVCEKAIVEEGTKNVSLINCFTTLRVQRIPSEPRQFTVFAALIDGAGPITFDVVVTQVADGRVLYRQSRRFDFGSRLQEVRFLFRVTDFSFPTAGEYDVSLWAENQILALHKIAVVP
jgi:hypothetical protein